MKPKRMFNEEQFLAFARSYFLTSFPNPTRKGCPAETALRSQACNPIGTDQALGEHIGLCSPCFNRYMELLAESRQPRE